jgi:type II secretory pathway component GspD/PulD (secretin)
MKTTMKSSRMFVASGLLATLLTGGILLSPSLTVSAHAQAPEKALPPITLDLRDAPVRQALEQLFNNAKVDFSIANEVQGFVTLKITDQPFENALRLILRSSSIPLTFVRESGVYIVKPRIAETLDPNAGAPPPITDPNAGALPAASYDQIQLTYIDSADLSGTLGITFIRSFTRQGGQGGQGGQQGGGMMGGMGGMGGGMMGGGMGGGMMGGMGGMGGGMMGGGMGGMGGGMGGMMGGGGFGGGRGF